MVQGINVNNYSVEQLKELKNAGVQGITDKDIEAAQQREAEAADAKKSDEANMEYTITDDAGETNEAQQEVQTAEAYGANLKNILGNLISKCFAQDSEMAKLQEEMNKYVVTMEDMNMQATELAATTQEEVAKAEKEVEAKVAEVEAKQAEATEKAEVAETIANNKNATDADKAKAEEAATEAEALSAEVSTTSNSIEQMQAKIQSKIQETALTKAALLGKSMEDVKNAAESNLNAAQNANEYADVTIDKGIEATEIKKNKEARKAGFKGIFSAKKHAHNMGNSAIAAGEHLGNSTVGVAKTIQQVGSQFGMGFAETSSINNLVNKEYVDTSALDNLQNPAEQKGLRNKIKTAKSNRATVAEIAEAAKKQKAEQAKAQTSSTGTSQA